MRALTFEETKQIELGILSYFADFCERNGLRYFLAYGTLLGAVRHKGFIPWDDDVDVQMPRQDCERLIEIFNKGNNSPYRLITPYDKESYYTILKIIDTRTVKVEEGIKKPPLGIDIDIFPMDGMPNDDGEYEKWFRQLISCYEQHFVLQSNSGKTLKEKMKFILQKIQIFFQYGALKKERILKRAEKLHGRYPYTCCAKVGSIECCFDEIQYRLQKEWFDEYIYATFENAKFRIPIGYDNILRAIYGDYMQLPPESQRVTHHNNQRYWKPFLGI